MSRAPIRVRVAAAFAVTMALVLAGTGWLLYLRLDSHLSLALERGLRLRAQDLAALVREPDATLAAASSPFLEHGESYAQLLDTGGQVVDATRPLTEESLLDPSELSRALRTTIFADRATVAGLDEPSRLLATPVRRGDARLVLVVGATSEERAETLRNLRNVLLIVGPIALALATLAGYALAGAALRPVESMRRRAGEISAETHGERLPVPDTRDEIARLASTLNDMLARLEEALERERDFVADAGHELRTPLALLRTELELALRHAESAADLKEAIRSSTQEVERLAHLADDLLLIAQSDRGKLPLKLDSLDVPELLRSIATRFEWRADDAHRPIHILAPEGLHVRGDKFRLEQALSNLVDNALRHGGGAVRLAAVDVDGAVELHVTDEGAGFPLDFADQAFERFSRADQARPMGGSGLGLSIVRAIAETHGGTAHIGERDDGGADVWISLPSSGPRVP